MSNEFLIRKNRKKQFLIDLKNVLLKHKAEIVTELESTNGGMDVQMSMYFDLNQGEYAQYDQECDSGYSDTRIDVYTINNILERL